MTTSRKARKTEEAKDVSFEEAIGKLEAIVQELEGSEISLEKSLGLFEEGVRLSKVCHRKLAEAEKKVQMLTRNDDGELEPSPFGEGGTGEDEDADDGKAGDDDVGDDGNPDTLF